MKHFNIKEEKQKKDNAYENKESLEKVISAYANKSEDEIMAEIIRLLASGEVDVNKLKSYAKFILPMLSKEQKEKLEGVLKQFS